MLGSILWMADLSPALPATETHRQRQHRLEAFSGRRVADVTAEELAAARAAGYEPGPDGWFNGRDPREMTAAELEALGHVAMSPLRAIRAKCLDCCAGSAHEVGLCVAI